MTINHLNLCVPNVSATRDFFERFLGFQCARPNDSISILVDDSGFVLTMMKAKADDSMTYPGSFHVGFYVEEAEVHILYARMRTAYVDVGDISTLHRGTMFYVMAPGGVLIEICCPRVA
ncbi:MAG: VOC family protein [Thermomicrobiales bacterium]